MPPTHHAVRYLLGASFARMAYVAWGDPDAPVVLCVHGLTRNGRDFDTMAGALADRFRVICPDLPGRGASDWLPDPMLYQAQHYVTALAHLLTVIDRKVAWVGTSLGGVCGMVIAAMPGNPIRTLVLNDVGPFISASALNRIRADMIATDGRQSVNRFSSLDAIECHLRRIHAAFGPLTDAQWAHLARVSARPGPDGSWALHHDPAIVAPLRAHSVQPVDLWPLWPRITAPVLAIRGANSDVLMPDTLSRMAASGAEVLTIPHAGHAPTLMDGAQIEAIRAFLSRPGAGRGA